MPYIENFILPPLANQLTLFGYLIILVYLLHIAFISVFLGSSLLSVIYHILDKRKPNRLYARFSEDLLGTDIYNVTLGVILGILPLVTLTILYSLILYGSGLQIDTFFILGILHVGVGLALLYRYQRTFAVRDTQFWSHIGAGIGGLLFLLAAYFILISATSLIMDFEKRSFIRSPDPYSLLFSWNVIARYKTFLFASVALTGGVVLFYAFRWSEAREDIDEDYRHFLKTLAAGVSLPCTMLLPVLIVWSLITLPSVALSPAVFVLAALTIVVLMMIFYILYSILGHDLRPRVTLQKDETLFRSRLAFHDKSKLVAPVLILLFVVFSLFSINDQIMIGNALRDHSLVLVAKAEAVRKEEAAKREEAQAEVVQVSAKTGEDIFNLRCTACHQYGEKLVGPPFNNVLPKYQPNPENLAAFIQSPQKINPEYPPMPNYGLNKLEATAVASYVLERLDTERAQ